MGYQWVGLRGVRREAVWVPVASRRGLRRVMHKIRRVNGGEAAMDLPNSSVGGAAAEEEDRCPILRK